MTVDPGKNFEGQVGFPTPTDHPEDTACRIFIVPDNAEWLGLLMGAVQLLLNPHNWYNWGDLSIDDTVDAWAQIVDAAYARSLLGQCSIDVPAPYWDDEADADDQADAEVQPWYGVLVGEATFQEQVEDWIFAGFIAYAGGINAAVAFLTIAPKFRLAWRTHDLGSIVKVFVDSVQVATVDTESDDPGIITLDIFPEKVTPEAESWNIWVEQASSSQMQLIRKKLDPNEVSPSNLRYNVMTDQVEETYDGGTTYVPQAYADPRSSPALQFPPIGGSDPQCQAASNMSLFVENLVGQTLTTLAEGLDAIGLATTLLPFLVELGPFAILIDLVISLASVLASAGVTALSAAFTSTVYDQLTCIFFCRIAGDGTVTSMQLEGIESDIGDQIGGLVETVMDAMLFLMGNVGLTNAGTQGDAAADCSGCACAWCFNFQDASRLGDWIATYIGSALATYSSGAWHSAASGDTQWIRIRWDFASAITLTDAAVLGYTPTGRNRQIYVNGTTTEFTGTLIWSNGSTVGTPYPISVTRIDVYLGTAHNGSAGTITEMQFSGTGDNEIGDSNC